MGSMRHFPHAFSAYFCYNVVIPQHSRQRRATYTEDGHIVLPSLDDEILQPEVRTMDEDAAEEEVEIAFDVIDDDQEDADDALLALVNAAATDLPPLPESAVAAPRSHRHEQESIVEFAPTVTVRPTAAATAKSAPSSAPPAAASAAPKAQAKPARVTARSRKTAAVLKKVSSNVQSLTSQLLTEGSRQYRESARDTSALGSQLYAGSKSAVRLFGEFLLQPVWVPGRKAIPVQRSRGALFAMDVVRFGGTFAGIFGALFLALNYQSFWEIARARMEPLNQASLSTESPVTEELQSILVQDEQTPASAPAVSAGNNLFSYVPPVGPPQPQLIIPKLGLNVPISIPSNEPLINQDWPGLEQEIQRALQDGVVHYPGTSEPGRGGNFFLTGHSSYYPWAPGRFKSVFARLGDLNVGDEYWVYYKGDKHRFVIDSKKEVRPSDVDVLDQPTDRRMSTLMTCWPVGTTLRRLILTSVEIDPLTGDPLEVGEHSTQDILPKVRVEVLPI